MSQNSQSIKALDTYICGDSGPLDNLNPVFVMQQKWAKELLYLLNKHPMSVAQISSMLKIHEREVSKLLEDLVRVEAVKEESGIYHVAFSIFTRNDLLILKRATNRIASKLSQSISTHKSEINSLVENFSSIEQVGSRKLLFAALGCFVLDWLGLRILDAEGLLIQSRHQPGNRHYLLFAREKVDQNSARRLYDKMYWGSHTERVGELVFTSFGDHHGVRYAFPDVLWALQASSKIAGKFRETPSWLDEKVSEIAGLVSKKLLEDVGLLLLRLNAGSPVSEKELERNNDKTWVSNVLHLLEDMNYIIREKGMIKLNYPVFSAGDNKIIKQLGDLVAPLVTTTIRQNHLHLKRALSSTTPIKNKIEFKEVLNEAWHWIFAQTNKVLAEKGFLYDPPKRRADEARYIAWVSAFSFP